MTKIIALVRTLNESKNIDRFCESYWWADEILIADGGSEDDTVSKARLHSNTYIYHFPERVATANGKTVKGVINPRGKHINFLIDWGIRRGGDILIFDDCDCVPSFELQRYGRAILETVTEGMVFVSRMFILGENEWFPEMTPEQSLWAWKSDVPIRADEDSYTISMHIPKVNTLRLEYPMALLHYFYPDEETLQRKKEQYIQTGEVLETYNPRMQFGQITQLPAWAKWR
jgi:glycosyltransferase involved in cell wall biosynthesis